MGINMNPQRKIIATAALLYANGPLHLGHLVEYIQTDIWVRFQKMRGHRCYYVCGSDAHGTPIMIKAEQLGMTPEAMVKEISTQQLQDFKSFYVKFDSDFTSTHDPINQESVNAIYQSLVANEDIESREIEQAYDSVKNMFLPDRFVKGNCPRCDTADQYGDSCENCGATYSPTELKNPVSTLSGTPPIRKKSLHFFFRLSKYETYLREWIAENHLQSEVANKLAEWFKEGLQDWDISRDSPYFGFEIPGQPGKYFYVWLDAPIGYISSFKSIGLNFEEFWGQHSQTELHHFIGKDIVYFHSMFWPAILHAAKLRTPSFVHAHGYLTVNGQKMSKSRGTFIKAEDYVKFLNPEYLRYYYAAKLNHTVEDIDLNFDDFTLRVNSDLVGKVINIASRCAGFISKKFNGELSPELMDHALFNEFAEKAELIAELYENCEYAKATREIMALADKANQFIDLHKPWSLAKEAGKEDQVQAICSMGLNLFKVLMVYLKPILPYIAEQSESFLAISPLSWQDAQKPLLSHQINEFKPLMTRVDPEKVQGLLQAQA
jgi:methionyl-tRNA synthetase